MGRQARGEDSERYWLGIDVKRRSWDTELDKEGSNIEKLLNADFGKGLFIFIYLTSFR